jgi:hypothetical protein
VPCGQVEDFLCGLFQRAHGRTNLSSLSQERKLNEWWSFRVADFLLRWS